MKYILWILNVLIAALTAINVIAWGHAVRSIGEPEPTFRFLLKLVFNRWYIIAISSAFVASLLSYIVYRTKGVLAGRYFLSLSHIATILAAIVVLGEKPKPVEWLGIALVIVGILLIGHS